MCICEEISIFRWKNGVFRTVIRFFMRNWWERYLDKKNRVFPVKMTENQRFSMWKCWKSAENVPNMVLELKFRFFSEKSGALTDFQLFQSRKMWKTRFSIRNSRKVRFLWCENAKNGWKCEEISIFRWKTECFEPKFIIFMWNCLERHLDKKNRVFPVKDIEKWVFSVESLIFGQFLIEKLPQTQKS